MTTEPKATPESDFRAQRGATLARRRGKRIRFVGGETYSVPSQSGTSTYCVDLSNGSCTCPDYELRGGPCKHLWAVRIARGMVAPPEGASVDSDDILASAASDRRITYEQNWPAYNRAQCEEKERVQILLRGLCDGIAQPPAKSTGRPRLSLADVIYGATMKVYVTTSGRRATTDIRECEKHGFIEQAPAYNSLFRYVENPALKPLLTRLVEESAIPLRALETALAADSTGFTTTTYVRWFDHKHGGDRRVQQWVKAHAMVGTATHVITAVTVTEGHDNDCPQFKPLLATTTGNGFQPKEVSGDKAYLSNENLAAIEDAGAVPYIPFKSNSSPTGNTEAWKRLWHYFSFHKEEFLSRYHLRSNVEAVFSSVKRKFGGAVRSKLPAAQHNEVLLKCLCHNLSMLVHAIHELGIDPKFWLPRPTPPKPKQPQFPWLAEVP